MYSIYSLVDPRDNTVRYVGMTNDVYRRFFDHINGSGGNYAKNAWIMELRALNKMVIMVTLEEVADRDLALGRERYWIQHFEMLGSPVMNLMGVISARNARKKIAHIAKQIEKDFVKIDNSPSPVSPHVSQPSPIPESLIQQALAAWNNGHQSTRSLAEALSVSGQFMGKDKAWKIIREMRVRQLINSEI
jgi:predicted GIY-YIG superfamily endonuclease